MASKETVATPPPAAHRGVDRFGRRLRPVRRDRRQGRAHVGAIRPLVSPHWRAWCARAGRGLDAWVSTRRVARAARDAFDLESDGSSRRANDLSDTRPRAASGGRLPLLALAALVTAPAVAVAAAPPTRARHEARGSTACAGRVRLLPPRRSRALDRRPDPRPSPRVPPLRGRASRRPAVAWTSALVALVASQFWAHSWTFARSRESPLLSHRSSHRRRVRRRTPTLVDALQPRRPQDGELRRGPPPKIESPRPAPREDAAHFFGVLRGFGRGATSDWWNTPRRRWNTA